MNSKQRRKLKRVMQRTHKRLSDLKVITPDLTDKWNELLVGVSPAGKTNKWEASNVTVVDK